jgi:hypothetical protein
VRFEVPNRTGAVVQISGRSANALDVECRAELCTLTRWQVGGAGAGDGGAPPAPLFGLGAAGAANGSVELSGVSFPGFTNTRTISAGTLALYYWDELQGAPDISLASAVGAEDEIIVLNQPGAASSGDYVQIGKEVLRVTEANAGGLEYRVTRGAHTSTASAHDAGAAVYHLQKKLAIVPFVKDFFGSPLSGDWSHPVHLPNARIASAEFSVTNSKGTSEVSEGCLTHNADSGLRILCGGQYSIQVDGFLAVDSAPAPELIVEAARSVRDVFAALREPADGVVELAITQNGEEYCRLTIEAGAAMSNAVDGFGLRPLEPDDRIGLEVLTVGPVQPGTHLTVVIRL